MSRFKLFRSLLVLVGGLCAAAVVGSAFAQETGCVTTAVPSSSENLVTDFDGGMTCDNILGQFGCSIDDGVGSCTAQGPNGERFTATSTVGLDGVATWTASDFMGGIQGVDTVIIDNAAGANGCLASFGSDATGGTAVFIKSNLQPANIRALNICADLLAETPPPPPEPVVIDECVNQVNVIDGEVEVMCPPLDPNQPATAESSIICNYELTDENGDPVPFYGLRDADGALDADSCCVCNRAALQQCDPELTEAQGGCPQEDPLTPFDTEVTTFFELNNDPYVCYTVAGRRKCYAY